MAKIQKQTFNIMTMPTSSEFWEFRLSPKMDKEKDKFDLSSVMKKWVLKRKEDVRSAVKGRIQGKACFSVSKTTQ